jgi:hypothetical protein
MKWKNVKELLFKASSRGLPVKVMVVSSNPSVYWMDVSDKLLFQQL